MTIFFVATPSIDTILFDFFLVHGALLRCRVVIVAKLKHCRVPSSESQIENFSNDTVPVGLYLTILPSGQTRHLTQTSVSVILTDSAILQGFENIALLRFSFLTLRLVCDINAKAQKTL